MIVCDSNFLRCVTERQKPTADAFHAFALRSRLKRPCAPVAFNVQAGARPSPSGSNPVGAPAAAAVRSGAGPAAAGGPAAAPAVPGEAQATVPASAAHHQQGTAASIPPYSPQL